MDFRSDPESQSTVVVDSHTLAFRQSLETRRIGLELCDCLTDGALTVNKENILR